MFSVRTPGFARLFQVSAWVLLLQLGAAFAAPTAAQFGTIINLAGRQRMLSQKMTKELLLASLDIDKTANLANAAKTAELFDTTLKGLRNGDAALGLPPTEEPRIVRQLDKVAANWAEYHKLIAEILATGAVARDQIGRIAELNLPLVDQMNRCVKLYEDQASGGSLAQNQALAVAVNLSGKQRMLSQRMSKEFLLLALGHEPESTRLKLLETTDLFARTLKGLRDGDTTLELSAAINTPAILAQLGSVEKQWLEFEPLMRAAIKGGPEALSPAAQRKVAAQNLPLLTEMNKAVGLYEALAK